MASSSSSSLSSSSSSPRWIYDVFLSFRGEDTRCGFASHLYAALDRKGINCYKDEETLKRGREISPELLKAIESSRFALVVFSQNYAFSRWCLDELVKILQCRREMGQTVLPIFYHVDPSYVRKHMAFPKTQVAEDLQRWKEALTEASNIAGLSTHQERSEYLLVEEVASFIFDGLKSGSTSTAKELFGIDSRIKEINSLLWTGIDDVRFVGIWGMGGIGKTTIAQVVYEQISGKFDGSCFLANVKDSDLVCLQEKLLCNILMRERVSIDTPYFGANVIKERLCSRKVLIVLDDVDKLEQLEALAGNCHWFGSGSLILITTRDKQLLIAHNVERIYKAKELNHQEAVELFCSKAFKTKIPPNDFVGLSYVAVSYANGLPLALKVLGSFLCGRGAEEWEGALHKLKTCPDEQIQRVLKISYDALDDRLKNLFLDIACFFNGGDKEYVSRVLEGCDFFPLDFSLLTEKSLMTIQDNKVLMHDLLQEMGQDIVYKEYPEEPGKRSRLWIREDVSHVLTKNSGTEAVKGIVVDLHGLKEVTFNSQAFVKMNNLRLLKICCMQSPSGFDYLSEQEVGFKWSHLRYAMPNELKSLKEVHLLGSFEFISDRLRCLYWYGFPLKFLPSRFHPQNLVELNMCYSNITRLSKGTMVFEKLRYMKLCYCTNLTKTPDFTGVPNLERLFLEGCTNLVEVHPSLGVLKRLILLNMKYCKKLKYLPGEIELDSLKYLNLIGCTKLIKFPEIIRPMPYLQELHLEGTSIRELPLSIRYLTSLVKLDLSKCKHLVTLPRSICMLQSLEHLNLSGCLKLEELPEELGNLVSLVGLYVDRTAISRLPSSIMLLKKLSVLSFQGCSHSSYNLWRICFSSLLSRGTYQIPRTLELSPISKLSSLCILDISGCNLLTLPDDIGNLSSLMQLYLSHNMFSTLPSTISELSKLKILYLKGCERLRALPQLPSTINTLVADNCTSLEMLPTMCILDCFYAGFLNCAKLLENHETDVLVGVLQNQLQVPNPPSYFDVIIPGREIPKWFCDQNMGDTVSAQLPPNWYDSVTGITMCVVFESRDGNHPSISEHAWGTCTLDGCCRLTYFIGAKDEPEFKSNEKHLWVGCLELGALNSSEYARRDDLADIRVSFASNPKSGFVIEKCGTRLVHGEYVNDKRENVFLDTYSSDESDSDESDPDESGYDESDPDESDSMILHCHVSRQIRAGETLVFNLNPFMFCNMEKR